MTERRGGSVEAGFADNDQELVRRRLVASATDLAQRVREHATLTPAQLSWVPPSGGWTIAQVYEHMTIAADSYLDALDPLLATAPAAPAGAVWKPSCMGGLLAQALRSRPRLPAPRKYQVDRTRREARAGAVARYAESHDRICACLDRTRTLDWRRLRLASPVSRLVRMNLGDALTILVVHAERHLGQIERVRGAQGFPAH